MIGQDGVFRMSLSPDSTLLAVIHFSGRLSLWDIPSLKQRATWSQDLQVCLWVTCDWKHPWFCLSRVNLCALPFVCRGNILYIRCLAYCINVISFWPRCVVRKIVWMCVCLLPSGRKWHGKWRTYICRMLCGFVRRVCMFCFIAGIASVCVCVKSVNRVSRLISSPIALSSSFPPFFIPSFLPAARIWGDQPRVEDIAGEKEENKR